MLIFIIFKKIDIFNKYNIDVQELQLLNKDFDTFTSISNKFVNYNEIVNKQRRFHELLDELSEIDSQYRQIIIQNGVQEQLERIKKLYLKKELEIEYFKSQNVGILSAMFYIFDVKRTINKADISQDVKDFIDNVMLDVLQDFSNAHFHYKTLLEDIDKINTISSVNNICK